MSVGVVIPWRATGAERIEACQWVLWKYRTEGWTARLAEAPAGDWRKGMAVNAAVSTSKAEVIVVADADVWCEGLPRAVSAVEAGAKWAIPHQQVHRLTQDATQSFLAGAEAFELPTEQKPYWGIEGGGLVVLQRAVIDAVPIDPRFFGWGQEDESWGIALNVLAGKPWQGDEPLVHLWHPPQQRLSRKRGSIEGWELRRRYLKSRHSADAMRELVEEAHAYFRTADPHRHDHA